MKIAAAQLQAPMGNIEVGMERHIHLIRLAAGMQADIVVFPELSLTGYEPQMAEQLAKEADDTQLTTFQQLCDQYRMTIGLGFPQKGEDGIYISQCFFQPQQVPQIYSKRFLHEDEKSYFIPGEEQWLLPFEGGKLAPAICFESLLPEHIKEANDKGATVYMASVAKSQEGVNKAYAYYQEAARQNSMTILMANFTGSCDTFHAAGLSACWNSDGTLAGQLSTSQEGVLVVDTQSGEIQSARHAHRTY